MLVVEEVDRGWWQWEAMGAVPAMVVATAVVNAAMRAAEDRVVVEMAAKKIAEEVSAAAKAATAKAPEVAVADATSELGRRR